MVQKFKAMGGMNEATQRLCKKKKGGGVCLRGMNVRRYLKEQKLWSNGKKV